MFRLTVRKISTCTDQLQNNSVDEGSIHPIQRHQQFFLSPAQLPGERRAFTCFLWEPARPGRLCRSVEPGDPGRPEGVGGYTGASTRRCENLAGNERPYTVTAPAGNLYGDHRSSAQYIYRPTVFYF